MYAYRCCATCSMHGLLSLHAEMIHRVVIFSDDSLCSWKPPIPKHWKKTYILLQASFKSGSQI